MLCLLHTSKLGQLSRKILPGLRHAKNVLCVAAASWLIGIVAFAWPCCLAVLAGAESLVKCDAFRLAGRPVALSPFTWPHELHDQIVAGDRVSMRTALFVREANLAAVTLLLAWPAVCACFGTTRRVLAIVLTVGISCIVFLVGYFFNRAAVDGEVSLPSAAVEPLVRAAFHSVTWVPVTALTLLVPFPRSQWRSACLPIAGVIVSSMICYFGWRATCTAYFLMHTGAMRVLVGVFAPHALAFVGFELYFLYAKLLLQHCGIGPASLWLIAPLGFGASTAATLQQGASDVTSGVAMEFIAMLVELKAKRCLLLGRTPLQDMWLQARFLVTCARLQFAKVAPAEKWVSGGSDKVSEIAIVPLPSLQRDIAPPNMDELPTTLQCGRPSDVQSMPSDGTQDSEMDTDKQSMDSATSASPDTWGLLAMTAIYSNIVEMIVHVSVAAVFIMAKLNPNASGDAPIPPTRVLVLLSMKVLFELCTDIVFATWAARSWSASRTALNAIEEMWKNLRWWRLAYVCVSAFVWGIDSQTTFVLYLCPYAAEGGASLMSLGMCPLSTFV